MAHRQSCVIYDEWVDCIKSIPDKAKRCELYEAILDYALEEEEPKLSPEYMPIWILLKSGIDRNIGKYDKAIEQRKNAIKARWQKQKDKKSDDTGEYDRIRANTDEYEKIRANTSEYDRIRANTDEYEKIRANTAIPVPVRERVREREDYSPSTSSSKNNLKKNTPLPPKGGVVGGGGEKGFRNYMSRVAAVKVPPMVEKCNYTNQYVWRIAEGMPAFAEKVDTLLESIRKKFESEQDFLAQGKFEFENEFSKYVSPTSIYQTEAGFQMFLTAKAALSLKDNEKAVLCKFLDNMASQGFDNPQFWKTMREKVEYILGHTVLSLEGFLKNNQQNSPPSSVGARVGTSAST